MEQELSRIGVSLPENLLTKFDEVIGRRGYSSRSEGIRDAIRSYIRYYEWMSELEGERVGTISFVYDHHQRGIVSAITDLEHEYSTIVRSSVHLHIDGRNCMEVLILHGEGRDIKTLAEKLMAIKGARHVKLTTVAPGEKL